MIDENKYHNHEQKLSIKSSNSNNFFIFPSAKQRNLAILTLAGFLVISVGLFLKPVIDARKIQPLESQVQELKLERIKKQDEYQQLNKQKQEIDNRLNNLSLSIKNIDNQLDKKSVTLSKLKNSKDFLSRLKAIFHIQKAEVSTLWNN